MCIPSYSSPVPAGLVNDFTYAPSIKPEKASNSPPGKSEDLKSFSIQIGLSA